MLDWQSWESGKYGDSKDEDSNAKRIKCNDCNAGEWKLVSHTAVIEDDWMEISMVVFKN